ncbi:ankyrin repeat domain-containing protein 46-like isoform X2 [Littorina saxatilis]|uniref:ankyrin repeat domain-containing protein 46-like isoform X2 n=1 Tax=Littorina saxatilis TaxID=31220 RepID=UPI0038B419C6
MPWDFSDMMECSCKLHDAVLEGDVGMVKSLLRSASCDVNEADEKSGRTALHLAAMRGRADLTNVLLCNGADVNACDNLGNTPLHWCGHAETIELLAEHGAHVLQMNKRGLTPRDLAERKGVSESVFSLLCQLEMETKDSESQSQTKKSTVADSSQSRFSATLPGKRSRSAIGQPLSGLWQELAAELGGRNSVLLLVGLLGLSLYVTYILVGINYGSQARIPIDKHGDSFRVRM